MKRDFLNITDLSQKELERILEKTIGVKKKPGRFSKALGGKTMLMLFEKPSLRTRVSFETGMTQLGGHAIYYDIKESTIGEKETIADFARVVSGYCDFIGARVFEHEKLVESAKFADKQVINMLSNDCHPCQALADLFTIKETFGKLKGLKLSYFGDGNSNVAHSLLLGCAMVGMNISVCCPQKKTYLPSEKVLEEAKRIAKKNHCATVVSGSVEECTMESDAVYTDSWMSYNVPKKLEMQRVKELKAFRVDDALMKKANRRAVFMHCLPAKRGMEVTNQVIEGKQSIVFRQAENRMHAQKALLLWLAGK